MTIKIDSLKKAELEKVLLSLVQTIDITRTQYENLVKSYGAVGKYLEEAPEFKDYHPVISPQGSLRLGTIIQPVNEEDDLDVDLVYRLNGKHPNWTQKDLKNKVGQRLQSHGVYKPMMDKEGRRCWTLLYRQDSENLKERYHMDILPCVADLGYRERVRLFESLSFSQDNARQIAIRITDNQSPDYNWQANETNWLKSNPDGYALWFASRCKLSGELRESVVATIMPIGRYNDNKCVLQRIVQILKRHRDIMFHGDDDKPISIIITTLAARAYNGEHSLVDGLCNVVDKMELYIQRNRMGHYVVANPVNSEENFADKWPTHPKREENFFKWLKTLKEDLAKIAEGKGLKLREDFGKIFGDSVSNKVFANLVSAHKSDALNSKLKISSAGILGTIGTTLNAHNTFYGNDD